MKSCHQSDNRTVSIGRFLIAGHTICITGEGLAALPGFGFFMSEKTHVKPLLTIRQEKIIRDWTAVPFFISEFDNACYDMSVSDNVYLIRMKQPDGRRLWAEIHREKTGFHAVIRWSDIFDDYALQFVCWLLFGVAALSKQTVSIHSSTVIHHGKSVFFLGESGTGKSTHTRMWLNRFPDTTLLNDDSPFVRVETDGSISAYGSPWSGKTPCFKNMNSPVSAFVRLSQAPYNRIRRLKGIEAIGALLPSCPFAFTYDKQLSESIYSILSLMLRQLPVYQMECLPNVEAAEMVYNALKKDNYL